MGQLSFSDGEYGAKAQEDQARDLSRRDEFGGALGFDDQAD